LEGLLCDDRKNDIPRDCPACHRGNGDLVRKSAAPVGGPVSSTACGNPNPLDHASPANGNGFSYIDWSGRQLVQPFAHPGAGYFQNGTKWNIDAHRYQYPY
jgi:hypothetical protein